MKVALAWFDLSDPTDRAVALNLGRELARLGHQLLLIGPRRRPGQLSAETVDGVRIRRVGSPGLRAFPWLNDAWAFIQLRLLHASEGIEVWHCHLFARRHRPLAWAVRSGGWPCVMTLHLVLKDYLSFLGGESALRELLACARHVTAVSEATRKEMLSFLTEKLAQESSVVHNAAGGGAGYDTAAPGAAFPALPKPYILCVARLAPYKGLDVLLMAFAQALESVPGLHLAVCGRDQMQGGLDGFIRDLGLAGKVTLTGELPRSGVEALLRDCLFFVLSSRRENFPLVLLEAMGAGKTMVATEVGGVPEMVRHGTDGILVPPNDVRSLGQAIVELTRNAERRRELERAALERSRDFGWPRAAAAYAELYAAAVQKPA